jgi:hypothetical protein
MFTLLFLMSPAAGAIEPPYKEIEYCYRIDNISDYPQFTIVARYPHGSREFFDDPYIPLEENTCFSRTSSDEIVAVRKDRFRVSGIQSLDYADQWKEIEYFDTSKDVLHSGISIPVSPVKVYDLDDRRTEIEDIFTIDALDDTTFSLRLAKKIVQHDDGSVQEKVYTTAAEGIADPPASAYRYTNEPASPTMGVLGGERRLIRNDCYPGEECFDELRLDGSIRSILIDDIPPGLVDLDSVPLRWYEEGLLLSLVVLLILHLYIGTALFVLAHKFGTSNRWRSWIPVLNLSLLVSLARKRQWWFWLMTLVFCGALLGVRSFFSFGSFPGLAFGGIILGAFVLISAVLLVGIFETVMLSIILAALAVRCGRPVWWGPLMVLVPPGGLVLLGIMAWSKQKTSY